MSNYEFMITFAAVLVLHQWCRVYGQAAPAAALARSDIEGQDINCGQMGPGPPPERKPTPLSTCRVCGDWNSLIASCQSNPQCVAFSYDGSCGLLKRAPGPTKYREGYAVFVLTDKQSSPGTNAAAPVGPRLNLSPGVQQPIVPVPSGPSAQPAAAAPPASQQESWTTGSTKYTLFSKALSWEQAEQQCAAVGKGWHLASITTEDEYRSISNKLVPIAASFYKHGGALLVGCGPDGKDPVPTVWLGLHDPTKSDQSRATWATVARTFQWVDGNESPFLLGNPDEYFGDAGAQSQPEHCIGLTFCTNQAEYAGLDKHPCDWEMSFLCKGPAA